MVDRPWRMGRRWRGRPDYHQSAPGCRLVRAYRVILILILIHLGDAPARSSARRCISQLHPL
eukprot:7350488-Prymnesium_polylepis.1